MQQHRARHQRTGQRRARDPRAGEGPHEGGRAEARSRQQQPERRVVAPDRPQQQAQRREQHARHHREHQRQHPVGEVELAGPQRGVGGQQRAAEVVEAPHAAHGVGAGIADE
ncbi:MAG: hypothetical protein ACK56I_13690, partial [bacterium]